MQAVAGQLFRRHIIANLAAGSALGQQVSDEVPELLVGSRQALASGLGRNRSPQPATRSCIEGTAGWIRLRGWWSLPGRYRRTEHAWQQEAAQAGLTR